MSDSSLLLIMTDGGDSPSPRPSATSHRQQRDRNLDRKNQYSMIQNSVNVTIQVSWNGIRVGFHNKMSCAKVRRACLLTQNICAQDRASQSPDKICTLNKAIPEISERGHPFALVPNLQDCVSAACVINGTDLASSGGRTTIQIDAYCTRI